MVAPPGHLRVELPKLRAARRELAASVASSPRGTAVVLSDAALGSSWRCRRFLRQASCVLSREYLMFPTLTAPAYLVQAQPLALAHFWQSIAGVPPGTRTGPLAHAVLHLVRRFNPWRAACALTPSRVLVGVRV